MPNGPNLVCTVIPPFVDGLQVRAEFGPFPSLSASLGARVTPRWHVPACQLARDGVCTTIIIGFLNRR